MNKNIPVDIKLADWMLRKIKNYKGKRLLQIEKASEENWHLLFSGNNFIDYITDTDLKIRLYKDSTLSKDIFEGFEMDELQFIKRVLTPGDIFIDAGANIGLFSLNASQMVGNEGKVISFEPTPTIYDRFLENYKLNNIKNIVAENIGLSDCIGTHYLNISENGLDAWNTFATESHIKFSTGMDVKVETLDNYIAKKNIESSKIKFIKIDVEGWEVPVIKGAKNTLLSNDGIILMIEFTQKNSLAAGYDCYQLYDQVTQLGYKWFFYNGDENILVPEKKRTQYPYLNLIAAKNIEALNKYVPVKY